MAMDIFNAVRRKEMKDTILSPEIGESVKLWMEWLQAKGWAALYEPTPGEEDRSSFTLALCSPWQRKLNMATQYALIPPIKEDKEKIFLNTILTRDCITGKGVPLAFMLTNCELQ